MNSLDFKRARRRLGYSLSKMARALGVSPRHIRRYEAPEDAATNRRIPYHTAALIDAMLEGYVPRSLDE